ncbi:unnamed protein product [Adineta ricciae]|uniref:G-protein coupled receptors family 1 profile domain-containing protein n=1 Tax=Adineta ricciae TaxID=249248 RepID=A0A815EB78_ADIRI|nr:unnamed protein product [Adineta ricciae]CAF1309037.1 unnamed protein product [Adineta ricciae]
MNSAFDLLSSLVMVSCSLVGLICSLTFILIVVTYRSLQTVTIMLAFNSAVAGFIINVTCGCQAIYQIISDGNDQLCSFRGFLLHAATGLLYHTLCVQALRSLFVVVFSAQRSLQSKPIIASITIVQWLISIMFAIPALVIGRIVYQAGSHICQASLNDLVIFLYLSIFIYFGPVTFILSIYTRIVYFAKHRPFSVNAPTRIADERRQRRELRFVRRLLIVAMVIGFMSCPYILFFLRAQIFSNAERLPYAQRLSFIFLSFGYAIWMLLNLAHTDEVRKHLFSKILCVLPQLRRRRVEPGTTTHTNTRAM